VSVDTLVKVLCDSCGRFMCRVVDHGDHLAYRTTVGGGGLHLDAAAVFCPDHGWPNLADEKLLAQVKRARDSGKVATHRARCAPHLPTMPSP